MAKFKVGDITKANEKSNDIYGVTSQENGWIGKVTKVEKGKLFEAETITSYQKKGITYGDICSLNEEYFDLVDGNQIIKQIVNNNIVVIILEDGRKGVAKCSPSDKFNLAFGTALAVARAYGDKETEVKLLAEPVKEVKEEPKFKVGELVRIRQWDDMKKEFGINVFGSIDCKCHFTSEMEPLCGKYAEISRLHKDGLVDLKLFNCEGLYTDYNYSTGMIEKV